MICSTSSPLFKRQGTVVDKETKVFIVVAYGQETWMRRTYLNDSKVKRNGPRYSTLYDCGFEML